MFSSAMVFVGLVLGQVQGGPDPTAAPPQSAATPTAQPAAAREAEVRRLVKQLDSPKLRERNQARDELLKMDESVVDQLLKAVDPSRPGQAELLKEIIEKLQRSRAQTTLQPSRVTLAGELPLAKILAAIQEQTGNKILDARREAGDERELKLAVQFDKTPFWPALDQVLDQGQLKLYPFGQEKAVKVLPQTLAMSPRAKRAAYSGPFRIEPVQVLAQRDLRSESGGSLRLTLELSWEPRLTPISLQQPMAEIRAVGDDGKPLAVAERGADLEVPVKPDTIAEQLVVPLALPPRQVSKIASLKGTLRAMVPGKVETFRFDDLEKAKNVERRVAGVTVVLSEVRKNNDSWEVRLVVHFDEAGGSLASHRLWIFDNPAFLEDKDGKRVEYFTSETTRQKRDEVGVAYVFNPDKPLSNYRFVYQTAAMIFTTSFDYELKDIELP